MVPIPTKGHPKPIKNYIRKKRFSKHKKKTQRLDLKIDPSRKRRGSICITPGKLESLTTHHYEKSETIKKKMIEILGQNFLFSGLTSDLLLQAIDRMWLSQKKSGEVIYQQNDPADLFYFFEEGECIIVKSDKPSGVVSSCDKPILGEIALFQKSIRDTGLTAKTDCRLWALDGYTYRSLLCANNKSKIEHMEKLLVKVPFFSTLPKPSFSKLVDAIETLSFSAQEVIVEKGDALERFYLVDTGQLTLKGTEDVVLNTNDYFGEGSLLMEQKSCWTVECVTQCSLLSIEGSHFRDIMSSQDQEQIRLHLSNQLRKKVRRLPPLEKHA